VLPRWMPWNRSSRELFARRFVRNPPQSGNDLGTRRQEKPRSSSRLPIARPGRQRAAQASVTSRVLTEGASGDRARAGHLDRPPQRALAGSATAWGPSGWRSNARRNEDELCGAEERTAARVARSARSTRAPRRAESAAVSTPISESAPRLGLTRGRWWCLDDQKRGSATWRLSLRRSPRQPARERRGSARFAVA